MRPFVVAAVGYLAVCAPLGAQEDLPNFVSLTSYVLSIPSGDARPFVTSPSWIGLSWEGLWATGRRTTAGIAFGVHNFNDASSGTTNYQWGAATGEQTRNLLVTTAMATGRWYPLAERTRRLHLGLGAGAVYSEASYRLGVSQTDRSATHLSVAPEVGWQFPIIDGIDALVSARYTIPARSGGYIGGARSYPFVTLSFGVLER